MEYLEVIILSIVEGATEFLPISSTFHLIWTSRLMGIPHDDFHKAFEVIIQGGAILAVGLLYFKTFFTDQKLILKTALAFIPTAMLGLVFYPAIKNSFFESYLIQLIIFALVGFYFIYFEKSKRKLDKSLNEFSFNDAFIIGIVQALAIFPGVSRAGAVIIGMMYLGFKRSEAAKFSFLLAVPTLLAASVLDVYKVFPVLSANPDKLGLLLIGILTSFISATLVVKWFIKYLQSNTLKNFGYYRIAVAVLLFILFFV